MSQKKSSRHCCVPGCVSDDRKRDPSIYFHQIPKDKTLRKQWIQKIRRDEGPHFKITNSTVVCSVHFKPDDYKWTPVIKTLKKGTVPSQFWWTQPTTSRPVRATKRKYDETAVKDIDQKEEAESSSSSSHLPVFEEILPTEKTPEETILLLNKEIEAKDEELKKQQSQLDIYERKLSIQKFGVERFGTDEVLMKYYTGFPSIQAFKAFSSYIEPSANCMQSFYYAASETVSNAGKPRVMLLIDELFMFLCRIRVNMQEIDLSVRFNCSQQSVSRKIITWANFLYFALGRIPIWLSRHQIDTYMPAEFKSKYPSTRVIIDCTEIFTQSPSSLVSSSKLYSNYKSHSTFKCLIGIAPHGALTFVSSLYTGNISDVEITKLSGLLDLIEPGDSVMADKGFTIQKMLHEKGADLNIPHFLRDHGQFQPHEIAQNEQISALRIHVERFIRRVKENRIFQASLPLSLAGSVNQMWTVACILSNIKGPLIKL